MNKCLLPAVFILCMISAAQSQDFEINFSGGDAVIDSVIVTNLNSGESLWLPGNAKLILQNSTTGLKPILRDANELSVTYPSGEESVIINYSASGQQKIMIRLADISGRMLMQKIFLTSGGINRYKISVHQIGMYFISITAPEKLLSTKVILPGSGNNHIGLLDVSVTEPNNNFLKSLYGDSYVLLYSAGDLIAYEFHSGKSITVIHEEAGTSLMLSPEFHECVDYQGNSYPVVQIGDQWWMAENLRSTNFADGTEINIIEADPVWAGLWDDDNSTKACCFYNNDEGLNYGAFYNYLAAVNGTAQSVARGVCPAGWHLPDNHEWRTMMDYLISHGYNSDGTLTGNKMGKSLASASGWDYIAGSDCAVGYNQRTNNRTGFNAFPTGKRGHIAGSFLDEHLVGTWWSATEHPEFNNQAYRWYLNTSQCSLDSVYDFKSTGISVRCIKNYSEKIWANFSADKTTVSLGEEVTFTDLSSGEPIEWKWDFGDYNSSTQQNPSHFYSSPGKYTVSLEIKNSNNDDSRHKKTEYISVTADKTRTVTDVDNNLYKTVKIGNQLWMAENLKSKSYSDGTEIPLITENSEWGSLATDNSAKAYCYFNNDVNSEFGALYTFSAAVNGMPYNGSDDVQGVCPSGWHVPSETDWDVLENYLIDHGYNYDGSTLGNKIGKSLASTSGWTTSTGDGAIGAFQNTNNKSGFNGLPGGYRSFYNTTGEFGGEGDGGYWWMANEISDETASFWYLFYNFKNTIRDYTLKRTGMAVRCLKNDDGSPLSDFSADIREVKLGGIVNFTDLSSNSPTQWLWNFDSQGETSSEENPSYRFTKKGHQRITLITSNEMGSDVETKVGYIHVTQNSSVLNDIDGNVYRTIEIGDQWWMAENLKTTKFNNGTDVPLVTDKNDWVDSAAPAYCWYENDQATYGETYGALYNWYTVNTGNLCPAGWHVPTDNDWKELETVLGMLPSELDNTGFRGSFQGSKLAGDKDLWMNNSETEISIIESDPHFGDSGFNALPGGLISTCSPGFCFNDIQYSTSWWSATEFNSDEAWQRRLRGNLTKGIERDSRQKSNGFSVRCVKD